jgi:hypothetical protein
VRNENYIIKLNKENMRVVMQGSSTKMCVQLGFDSMTVGYNVMPKGTDFNPLLQGLDNG